MKIRNPQGFTLLEMLTAIGVLSLMMVFMFNIAGQTTRAWETGRRRMEVAQAGRIGLDLLDSELRYAFAGVFTNVGQDAASVNINRVPFLVANESLAGESRTADYATVPGSQTIFFISPVGPYDPKDHVPFAEIGYFPTFIVNPAGKYSISGGTYALVRHGASSGVNSADNARYQDFYYRTTNTATNWILAKASHNNRTPIVDNCIRMTLQFASNNIARGKVDWIDTWTNQTSLPMGVLVTLLVIDEKSAAKLKQVNQMKELSADDITAATNTNSVDPGVQRILREGVSVVRRFVPLVNSRLSQ